MNYKVSVAVGIGIGSEGVKMIDISEIRQGFAVFFKIGLVYNNGGKNGLFFGAPFAFTYGIGAVDKLYGAKVKAAVLTKNVGYAKLNLALCGSRVKILGKRDPAGTEDTVLGNGF